MTIPLFRHRPPNSSRLYVGSDRSDTPLSATHFYGTSYATPFNGLTSSSRRYKRPNATACEFRGSTNISNGLTAATANNGYK